MSERRVNIAQARNSLSQLTKDVNTIGPVVLMRHNEPVAIIIDYARWLRINKLLWQKQENDEWTLF